jgi:hypothetical protein
MSKMHCVDRTESIEELSLIFKYIRSHCHARSTTLAFAAAQYCTHAQYSTTAA